MIARSAKTVGDFDGFVTKYLGRQGLVIISVGIADLALGDEPGERDGVVLTIFVEPHGRQISNIKAR